MDHGLIKYSRRFEMGNMTLYSIINAWIDTIELLPHCIDNHLKFCDGVIVVFSRTSNHFVGDNGEVADFIDKYPRGRPVVFELCEPVRGTHTVG